MNRRIQRSRAAGWRKPEGAVYVGRGSRYENPFVGVSAVRAYRDWLTNRATIWHVWRWHQVSVHPSYFDRMDTYASDIMGDWRTDLHGKDLMCWCSLDKPCHAEILLLELVRTEGAAT